MKPFRVIGTVLCEDVRQELNGKYMLWGVFGADIHLKSFPAQIGIFLFIQVENRVLGKHQIEVEVVHGREAISRGEVQTTIESLGANSVVIGPIILTLRRRGQFRVRLRTGDDAWETISSFSAVEDDTVSGLPRFVRPVEEAAQVTDDPVGG